jgi:hypothetical protein
VCGRAFAHNWEFVRTGLWQISDVEDIDDDFQRDIASIVSAESELTTPEAFNTRFEVCARALPPAHTRTRRVTTPRRRAGPQHTFFTVKGADGRDIELIADGGSTPITWENRQMYIRLAQRRRLREFDVHVAAIRRGLVAIIPERAVQLCMWQVCVCVCVCCCARRALAWSRCAAP